MTDTTTRPIQISYFIPAESLERDASGRIVAPEVPTTLAIKVGEAVRFIWDETNQRGSHTIAPAIFPSPVNRFDFSFMGAPAHGDISFQRTFTVPGFYEFVCGIHPETQILELTVNR